MSTLAELHFLRPLWLVALLPAMLLIWVLWRRRGDVAWRNVIAPHLLQHLLAGSGGTEGRLRPLHLLAAFWLVAVIAAAGPTWQREPAPFAEQRVPLVIVLYVGESMLAEDIQPTRLERASHKIRDLLALRPGARAALIAYAGSAHLVMPFTTDARLVEEFAGELSPELMPRPGNAPVEALTLATQLLEQVGVGGGNILLITDSLQPNAIAALPPGVRAEILAVAAPPGSPVPLSSPPAPPLDRATLGASARALNGDLVEVSVDDSDVETLARRLDRRLATSVTDSEGERWRDAGYYLLFPLAFILLLWFRRGWTVRWQE
jgi:Ca-activated chloride channel family protein